MGLIVMTKLLVKLFIKNSEDTANGRVRTAYGTLAGITGIVCNLFLFAAKLAIGLLSGSIAISADAVNNLSDASSSIVTLVGFKLSEKPADEKHPFGYARIEYLSALLVAVMIIVIGVELAKTSFGKILNPTEVSFNAVSFAVLALSVAVKLWMMFFNLSLGKKINSETLKATAQDSRNDVITTLAVMLSAFAAVCFKIQLDGYVGVAVAVFIIVSGLLLVKETVEPLLGEAATDELSQHIAQKILEYDGVLGVHDLIVHDYGPGRRFASVHVEMSSNRDVLESHDIIDDIERDFAAEENLHLVIHYDPVVTDNEEVNLMKNRVKQIVSEIDSRLSIHDFRMVKGPMHTNLIFDVAVPHKFEMSDEELKTLIDERIQTEKHKYYTVITVDSSFAAMPAQKDAAEEKLLHGRQ